jgi:LacI family transcriptional regulator/LacI family purine nucleotide synthesis repressor
MASMKDISAVCGVSIATVSKALNNHKDVGEDTKERIRQAAREMGYFPDSAAKVLKTNRSYNIGVLFVDDSQSGLTHDYFANVLDSFKSTAEQKSYDITFINCCKTRKTRMSYLEQSICRHFDGVVIACVNFSDPEVEDLVRSKIPVVTIDYLFNDRSAILSDNVTGMKELVEYIYKKGHRKIAYIHGADSAVTRSRLSSFYKTCGELGMEVPADYICESQYRDIQVAYGRTRELLQLKEPPTCIIYPDDFACFGGINAIHEQGLKVPEDISVAGYDGIQIAMNYQPNLTTVVQDTQSMGRIAAEKLISLIENPKSTLIEQIVVEGRVFEGGTVADIS